MQTQLKFTDERPQELLKICRKCNDLDRIIRNNTRIVMDFACHRNKNGNELVDCVRNLEKTFSELREIQKLAYLLAKVEI